MTHYHHHRRAREARRGAASREGAGWRAGEAKQQRDSCCLLFLQKLPFRLWASAIRRCLWVRGVIDVG